MKYLILFTFLFFAAANALDQKLLDHFKTSMTEKVKMCAKEVGAGPEDITTLLSKTIPESYEGKCILFCINKKLNVQDDNGFVVEEGPMAALHYLEEHDPEMHEKVAAIMITCLAAVRSETDACLHAAGLGTCVVKEAKTMGIDHLF